MELGIFSPDIDARFCYVIVVLAGMLMAVREVDSRLSRISGAWADPGAHRLFAFLWITPVVLFFLLDHAAAINDTSPVAAVVIAVTYGTLIGGAGQSGAGQPAVPGILSTVWNRLLGDLDKIQDAARTRIQLRLFDYARSAADEISSDRAKYTKLLGLARRLVPDPAALDASLSAIEHSHQEAALATWKKTETLIRALNGVYVSLGLTAEVHDLLRREGLIGWTTYLRYPGEHVGSVWRAVSVVVPAILITGLAVASVTDRWGMERGWLEWRLSKAHTTITDQVRTREELIERIQISTHPVDEFRALGRLIRDAGMSPARIETVIGVMTDGLRLRPDRDQLLPGLIDTLVVSLRAPNVDSRTRIHAALLYLAEDRLRGRAPNSDVVDLLDRLRAWKPSDVDSVTFLAARIDEWRRFFQITK